MKPKQEKTHAAHARAPSHPHATSILQVEDMPGTDDVPDLEPDLRYRMISEAAYHRYVERGCADGYDVDDWLAAEGDVERGLLDANKLAP
jgi:hypothetical protein